MKKRIGRLIMQTENVSVYEEERCSNAPNINEQACGIIAIGGIIRVVNNHNNKMHWKEWKWFQAEDGTVFNNKDYVVNMLINLIENLHIKEDF